MCGQRGSARCGCGGGDPGSDSSPITPSEIISVVIDLMRLYEGRVPTSYGIFNRWSAFTRGGCYAVSDKEIGYLTIIMQLLRMHTCKILWVTACLINARISQVMMTVCQERRGRSRGMYMIKQFADLE